MQKFSLLFTLLAILISCKTRFLNSPESRSESRKSSSDTASDGPVALMIRNGKFFLGQECNQPRIEVQPTFLQIALNSYLYPTEAARQEANQFKEYQAGKYEDSDSDTEFQREAKKRLRESAQRYLDTDASLTAIEKEFSILITLVESSGCQTNAPLIPDNQRNQNLTTVFRFLRNVMEQLDPALNPKEIDLTRVKLADTLEASTLSLDLETLSGGKSPNYRLLLNVKKPVPLDKGRAFFAGGEQVATVQNFLAGREAGTYRICTLVFRESTTQAIEYILAAGGANVLKPGEYIFQDVRVRGILNGRFFPEQAWAPGQRKAGDFINGKTYIWTPVDIAYLGSNSTSQYGLVCTGLRLRNGPLGRPNLSEVFPERTWNTGAYSALDFANLFPEDLMQFTLKRNDTAQ
jgi:hypothetical protein